MKYLIATLYLAVGIVLPVVYVNVVETNHILTREWILILALFIFCSIAGINWLFSNKENKAEENAPKPKLSPFATRGPSGFKTPAQRKIPQPVAQAKVVTAPRYQEQPIQKHKEPVTTTYPPTEKPDIKTLLEDVKNYIKLESWLMALQKANELIHFYPDSPDADKIRGNINFLIQKVKRHD